MKIMLCKLPVVYCGRWKSPGDKFEVEDRYVQDLKERCLVVDAVADRELEKPSADDVQQKPNTRRRRAK